MVMYKVNIAEAKAHLSQCIRRVKAGERVILCERNLPVAELRLIEPAEEGPAAYRVEKDRKAPGAPAPHPAWGLLAGTVREMADDFNAPDGDADWEAAQ